eukprot:CAMPEP_0171315578 /NCGR_PEP_ID=MMETSP0816-20121228/65391_1 /TAXON_ID=420281 /ORGANISM="Proboscia inermis, Strain CCAP1064/1" /LENGTH=49 /DNA_ID=CAMNT_0011806369 /DNA_START=231 /DNA_END=380 /DNA_ORIENTATION=-
MHDLNTGVDEVANCDDGLWDEYVKCFKLPQIKEERCRRGKSKYGNLNFD